MKIWHISDTHAHHDMFTKYVPKDIDVIVHSGDATNYANIHKNVEEMENFIQWYGSLDVKHKIYVAGNHDFSLYRKKITKEDFEKKGIIYLELEEIVIDGVKFFGNPYTPSFGNWAYMLDQLTGIYTLIPKDTDVLISHGPPRGMLDLTYEWGSSEIVQCGCKELRTFINLTEHQIKACCFGHIHDYKDIENVGFRIVNGILYSNAAVVKDREFGRINHYGNIFEIDENKNVKIIL